MSPAEYLLKVPAAKKKWRGKHKQYGVLLEPFDGVVVSEPGSSTRTAVPPQLPATTRPVAGNVGRGKMVSPPVTVAKSNIPTIIVVGVGYFDFPAEKRPVNLWALRIVVGQGLLITLDGKGKYHRVGWFDVNDEEAFENTKEAAVDLV